MDGSLITGSAENLNVLKPQHAKHASLDLGSDEPWSRAKSVKSVKLAVLNCCFQELEQEDG